MKKAVSLTYPKDADAPYISAIAKGHLAERLLEIAREHDVPIVQNDALTNVLAIQQVGDIIPEETYEVLAKIFAFIAKIDARLNSDEREYGRQ
ncbi:MAG: EscU/YscU/HrcU family type III secretion system export apparatus switch protein [Treponema sp.]|nr:EscU/YscU/HrcU family type III secretion system export apparatus switch protein [Treponema sp.]